MGRIRKFSVEEMFETTEQLLLTVGYEGFTVGLVAEQLNVSRAAIYKYYTNKEALIVDFMVERMQAFIEELTKIPQHEPFEKQVEKLLNIIFCSKDLHQVLGYAHFLKDHGDIEIKQKLMQLSEMHVTMYSPMQSMIEKGKAEGILKPHISNDLILGFIFQSIAIPNHMQIDKELFLQSLKEMIFTGIYNK